MFMSFIIHYDNDCRMSATLDACFDFIFTDPMIHTTTIVWVNFWRNFASQFLPSSWIINENIHNHVFYQAKEKKCFWNFSTSFDREGDRISVNTSADGISTCKIFTLATVDNARKQILFRDKLLYPVIFLARVIKIRKWQFILSSSTPS